MASNYCLANPFTTECLLNRDYSPNGGYGASGSLGGGGLVYSGEIPQNTISINQPVKIQSTQQGVNISQGVTTVDKVFDFITRIYALNKGAGYIPTTEQPNNSISSGSNDTTLMEYYRQQALANNNSSGIGDGLEKFVKENSTILLIGVGLLALVQMKPVSRRNPAYKIQNGLKKLVK